MSLENISELTRIETVSNDEMNELMVDQTHAMYSHAKAFGACFTIEEYIDTPPEELYQYLVDPDSISEWSYSLRYTSSADDNGVFSFTDEANEKEKYFCQITGSAGAKTIDYVWAKGQVGNNVYSDALRVVCAQNSLNKPGSVLLWTICISTDDNESEFSRLGDIRVSNDWWKNFSAQRRIELGNIKAIQQART